jgi:hypothetical protein
MLSFVKVSSAHLTHPFPRRTLNDNRLVGSIPSTIGQLTTLVDLYVFHFNSVSLSSPVSPSHAGVFNTTS